MSLAAQSRSRCRGRARTWEWELKKLGKESVAKRTQGRSHSGITHVEHTARSQYNAPVAEWCVGLGTDETTLIIFFA